jgi:2-polyprenyl-3-methyl-5-hydroxy-6-metoxy-1,4-benzoquinol methylase
MSQILPLDAPKGSDYYVQTRLDVLGRLPRPAGRVLDVGCGAGGIAQPLRTAGATWITGIELVPEAAERAQQVYDEVWVGDALAMLPKIDGQFDTILCYDVLEHLYDPLAVVRALRALAVPGGRLHVSLPNARHISLLVDLFLRGTFGYTAAGHRDVTHIRWFTRRDATRLLEEGGWSVQKAEPLGLQWRSRALHGPTRGRSSEFLAAQWAFVSLAEPR